jgi:hypothetical protein
MIGAMASSISEEHAVEAGIAANDACSHFSLGKLPYKAYH